MAEFVLGKWHHHNLSLFKAKVLEQKYHAKRNYSNASGRDDSQLWWLNLEVYNITGRHGHLASWAIPQQPQQKLF